MAVDQIPGSSSGRASDPPVNDGTPAVAASAPETWDRAAGSYDDERNHDRTYQVCLAAAIASVERIKPHHMLDVGCGTGLATLPLCAGGRRVVAVDYSFTSLNLLRRKRGAPPVIQADVKALPFPTGSWDVVLCANMLQHLTPEQHVAALGELRRVLAPGGTLILTVHHFSRQKQRSGWIKEGRPGQPGIDYIFRFSLDDLQRVMPRARVTAVGLAEYPWLPARVQRWLATGSIGAMLARAGYGHMLMAVEQNAHTRGA